MINFALVLVCLLAATAHAESNGQADVPPAAYGTAMPDGERALIDILADGQRQARRTRSPAETRIAIQIRVTNLLGGRNEAKNWIGTVKEMGKTADGERWLRIEIAPGITFSTYHDRTLDTSDLTLIGKTSSLFPMASELVFGERVMFDAFIYGGSLADDISMLEVPEMIVRFDALKPLQ